MRAKTIWNSITTAILVVVSFCVTALMLRGDEKQISESQESTHILRGEIVDSESKQPLPSRVSIRSANGTWYFPKSAAVEGSALEYRRQVGPTSLEQHVTLSAHPFEVELPAGTYTLTVERGKEYIPETREISISKQNVEVKVALRRWINMVKQGWYSGDVHSHRLLSEMPNLVMAEDLNVGMPLSNWVTAAETGLVTGNRISGPAPRSEWIAVDETHGIFPRNSEYEIFTVGSKPHALGAVLILGQSTTIDQGVPPVRRVAEQAHRDGAFLDLEKHSWEWTPMIVPLMKPDLFELSNNHCWPTDFAFHSWTLAMAPESMQLERNPQGFTEWGWIEFGFKTYYAYLNCGFRMMPSAGTGSGVHPVPLGFGRVYVQVPGEFSYRKWKEGLLAGHSFVTTGPMLQVTFNGQPAGHSIRGESNGTSVRITGSVASVNPLDRVEVISNGLVVKTIDSSSKTESDGNSVTTNFDETITLKGSGWIAVRSFDAMPDHRIRFAHTAPVFIDVPGKRQAPFEDEVEHFVERIEREIKRHQGVLSPESLEEYREALMTYRELLRVAIKRPSQISKK